MNSKQNSFVYDAVFISDLHLGNLFADIRLLGQFLSQIRDKTATLYLVGDIFDSWRHCETKDFIDLFKDFNEIVYISGNHDGVFAEAQNPLPGQAIEGQKLSWNGKTGLITHAHFFDQHFDKDSWWAKVTDAAIYNISRLIHCDIKAKLGKIGENYSARIEKSCSQMGRLFGADYMIIGHTHYGGERNVNGIRLFNLGSWITQPYALFKAGNQYSMLAVTALKPLPENGDFKPFFNYQ
jgi:UDP-2,3-diacylglucosamine pyrophosphatase LpxH